MYLNDAYYNMLIAKFLVEYDEIIFRKLRSHRQGPGEQVVEGLGEVHHIFFYSFLNIFYSR